MNFRLRRARPADTRAILALEAAVFPDDPFTLDQVRRLLRSRSTLTMLAVAAAAPRGLLSLWWRSGASTCRIVSVAVHPDWRRHGLGRRLVDWAINRARKDGFAGLTLEVAATNRPALKLYRNMGFSLHRRLPHYYSRGRHALRLIRWLSAGGN